MVSPHLDKKLVWVKHGKIEYPARLLAQHGTSATILWTERNQQAEVQMSSIRFDLPRRSRRQVNYNDEGSSHKKIRLSSRNQSSFAPAATPSSLRAVSIIDLDASTSDSTEEEPDICEAQAIGTPPENLYQLPPSSHRCKIDLTGDFVKVEKLPPVSPENIISIDLEDEDASEQKHSVKSEPGESQASAKAKTEESVTPMESKANKDESKANKGDCDEVEEDLTPPAIVNAPTGKVDNAVKVKLEQVESALDASKVSADRERRMEMRRKMNVDPSNPNRGRAVFRRGCNEKCITTILGGSGTHPGPSVMKPPHLENGENPFIQAGEGYLAGTPYFNPWTPTFPGDVGFACQRIVEKALGPAQKTFHMFTKCSLHPHETHYHGPNAANKTLYLGKYRVIQDKDDDVVESARNIPFGSIAPLTQWTQANWWARHRSTNIQWEDEGVQKTTNLSDLTEAHYENAKQAEEQANPGNWDKMSKLKQTTAALIAMLKEKEYKVSIVPVEFVSYDEDLYQALVKCGESNGSVSILDDELGPM